MSDTNQELVRALKQLSEQYEQQFAEVTEQVNVLAEQIILLTNSEPNNSSPLSQGGKTASELKEVIKSRNGESQCLECKQAKYTLPKSNGGQRPNEPFKFTCLLDHDNTESVACYQFDSRF